MNVHSNFICIQNRNLLRCQILDEWINKPWYDIHETQLSYKKEHYSYTQKSINLQKSMLSERSQFQKLIIIKHAKLVSHTFHGSGVRVWVIRVLCSGPHQAELMVSVLDLLLVFAFWPLQRQFTTWLSCLPKASSKILVLRPHLIRSVLRRMISLLIN